MKQRILIALVALVSTWANASTNYTLSVTADRPDAIYKQGETVTFTIKLLLDNQPVDGAEVNWIISKDGVPPTTNGKAKLAGGSVIVNLNERLDYFGSTVNMAARLQGQSDGGDIVLSRAVADDPAVRPLLAAVPTRNESVSLKGFDRPIDFVRVLAKT